jgi:protease-4
MGGYAASGGYLISETADHIFCHPHTITGSIGIYGVLFNIGEAASRFGITFDDIKTAPNADIMSISKPKTPLQIKVIQDYMNEFYSEWIKSVAEYRNLEIGEVDSIAGGRVWSGNQAVELGLADEIGGLQEAIAHAASIADLDKYDVYEYPRKLTEQEAIAQAFGLQTALKKPFVTPNKTEFNLQNWLQSLKKELSSMNDPVGVYALSPFRY